MLDGQPIPRLLVMIVAYQAESTIASVLARIPRDIPGVETEILVLDDGSQDSTLEVARLAAESGVPYPVTVLLTADGRVAAVHASPFRSADEIAAVVRDAVVCQPRASWRCSRICVRVAFPAGAPSRQTRSSALGAFGTALATDQFAARAAKPTLARWTANVSLVPPELASLASRALARAEERWPAIETVAFSNQLRVLKALQETRLGEEDFQDSSGYGYNDRGREKLEQAFASRSLSGPGIPQIDFKKVLKR